MSSLILILLRVVILTTGNFCVCYEMKSEKSLANFRKLMEETALQNSVQKNSLDPDNNFVSFLFENAKEIFSNSEKYFETMNYETTLDFLHTSSLITTEQTDADEETNGNLDMDKLLLKSNFFKYNLTEIFIDKPNDNNFNINDDNSAIKINEPCTKNSIYNNTQKFLFLEKTTLPKIYQYVKKSLYSPLLSTAAENYKSLKTLFCIKCNNIESMDCINPENRLISSQMCDHRTDLCYSMHTPFGIVDRGCLDVNHYLSTYVCSCNLCNYISISEMPYIFSGKRDWLENVKELSRTKRLRQSIHKDMSCLRCEVNFTFESGNDSDKENCLEGNINTLPMQECASNEICGVKAIKTQGYIWRGCLSTPLYNYWWTLCDTTFCNYDTLVSIYDEF